MQPPDKLQSDLQQAKSSKDSIKGFRHYLTACDTNADAYYSQCQSKMACKRGCSYCCHLRVTVKPHEVFAISDFVDRSFSIAEQAGLMTRLKNHVEHVRLLSVQEHWTRNIPCPFLVDGACSIHEARPFACRQYHSMEVAACQYSYDHPSDLAAGRPKNHALENMWVGMAEESDKVFASEGFDIGVYELGQACLNALSNPKCRKRWGNHIKPLL